jgi:hypothetical protein
MQSPIPDEKAVTREYDQKNKEKPTLDDTHGHRLYASTSGSNPLQS